MLNVSLAVTSLRSIGSAKKNESIRRFLYQMPEINGLKITCNNLAHSKTC